MEGLVRRAIRIEPLGGVIGAFDGWILRDGRGGGGELRLVIVKSLGTVEAEGEGKNKDGEREDDSFHTGEL